MARHDDNDGSKSVRLSTYSTETCFVGLDHAVAKSVTYYPIRSSVAVFRNCKLNKNAWQNGLYAVSLNLLVDPIKIFRESIPKLLQLLLNINYNFLIPI